LARLEAPAQRGAIQGRVLVVLLAGERGGDSAARVPRGDARVPVLFELPMDPPYADHYRLDLIRSGPETPVFSVEDLTVQSDGVLAALVPREQLHSGGLRLRVLAIDGAQIREVVSREVVVD